VSQDRELDVVVFGASGFVGRLTAEYLAVHAPPSVRIGLAGRSERRLAEVRDELGGAASGWPILIADSSDAASVTALARATRVVASTVGPYRLYGLPLVEACATAGTDYADLTGEVLFMRESIDRYTELATGKGARIVHSCGFDSVPSDLGVLALHQAVGADDAGDLEDTAMVAVGLKGGVSGGTIASGLGQLEEARASASQRRLAADPYTLSPDRAAEPEVGTMRDLERIHYDKDLKSWVGPYLFAAVNTRVVRRSNALQGWAYGKRFRYREVMGFGAGPSGPVLAVAVTGAMMGMVAAFAFRPSRTVLRPLLPSPGEGPSEKHRRAGYFRLEVHARTSGGARYVSEVAANGDPGYSATAVMFGESALCLALDRDQLPDRAGVLTPATAMGTALADRLRSAGFTLTARPLPVAAGAASL
jgi:short subunit dehydrogenase-like uncharacterized protein